MQSNASYIIALDITYKMWQAKNLISLPVWDIYGGWVWRRTCIRFDVYWRKSMYFTTTPVREHITHDSLWVPVDVNFCMHALYCIFRIFLGSNHYTVAVLRLTLISTSDRCILLTQTENIFVFLIENLNEIVPKSRSQWGLGHWESRISSKTSLRIKNLIKNLIKNQDLGQGLIEIIIENLNADFFSLRISKRISMRSCPRSWFLMRFLMRFLTFDEVFDELLDSQWGSGPRPHWDLDFGTISLRFSMRKTIFFRKGYRSRTIWIR